MITHDETALFVARFMFIFVIFLFFKTQACLFTRLEDMTLICFFNLKRENALNYFILKKTLKEGITELLNQGLLRL